jgi:hypothetical protein
LPAELQPSAARGRARARIETSDWLTLGIGNDFADATAAVRNDE